MRRSDCNREWLFDGIELEKTASRIDGLKSDEESAARAKAVWFLRDLGKVLGTKIFVIAAASVYFHRFFVFHSINKEKHDKLLVAAVCLFLAGKYEGCFNKVERVIAGYLYLRSRGRNISPEENLKEIQIQYQKLYNDPEKATEGREEKERLKSLFIEMEKSLLLTLCFELHVSHPHMAVAAHVSKMKSAKHFMF